MCEVKLLIYPEISPKEDKRCPITKPTQNRITVLLGAPASYRLWPTDGPQADRLHLPLASRHTAEKTAHNICQTVADNFQMWVLTVHQPLRYLFFSVITEWKTGRTKHLHACSFYIDWDIENVKMPHWDILVLDWNLKPIILNLSKVG